MTRNVLFQAETKDLNSNLIQQETRNEFSILDMLGSWVKKQRQDVPSEPGVMTKVKAMTDYWWC